ncbi:putative cell wall organization protein/glutathione transferase (Gto3) [Aspergillus undulatus]|uniref:putative cell wall organization protein/glutathione transferase (Gto3) n=1 Tax=Aspergillus undulatus TaxID=1810928 RepID=UPI003CCCE941
MSQPNISNQIHTPSTSDGWHGTISPDADPGSDSNPPSVGIYPPAPGRYHLYIGLFCPFAHRVNFIRHLKGLTEIIDISVVMPYPKGDENGWPGWRFLKSSSGSDGKEGEGESGGGEEYPDATVDRLFGEDYLHKVYFRDDPGYKGRYSVPVLWDRETGGIVCNESLELLRWLPTAFNSILPPEKARIDTYPPHLRPQIDSISRWILPHLCTGVYKAGFANTQDEYDKNVILVFGALNKLEKIVHANGGPFILGSELTELDILVYVTLIRFDPVYVQHFKCNLGTIRHDYPVLDNWLRGIYWGVEAARGSTNFKHIKENYTKSHYDINPKAITPLGPWPDIEEGFERDWSKLRVGGVRHPEVVAFEIMGLDEEKGVF